MTRPHRRRREGFTLVELMVVLVILGLAAVVVVLAMPEEGGSIQSEAERFAARAKAARDNAIVESRPALLRVDAEGYSLARRSGGAWREDVRLDWVDGTEVLVEGTDGAQTRFDTTGLAAPLSVVLRRRSRQVTVTIGPDGSVHVRR